MNTDFLLDYAFKLIEDNAYEQGAPIATGEVGPLWGRQVYRVAKYSTLRFEHITSGMNLWAAFDKNRMDVETMPIGYGRTIEEAAENFLSEYEDNS
jgi:hypothetical protein